jgi:exopolysaccharide biosynthesis protein
VSGPAVTDGEKWAPAADKRAALLINADGKPAVAEVKDPPTEAKQVVAGSDVIVRDGQNVAPDGKPGSFPRGPHPRTAVGIRDGGKTLVLVVIDGRKKGVAVGMSLKETADIMLKYGCTDAMNLDGGGSSMLGIRHPKTGKMEIKNNPSDGRERSVANVLGVTVVPKKK